MVNNKNGEPKMQDPSEIFGDMGKKIKEEVDGMLPKLEQIKEMASKGAKKIEPKEKRIAILRDGTEVTITYSVTDDVFIEFKNADSEAAYQLYHAIDKMQKPRKKLFGWL